MALRTDVKLLVRGVFSTIGGQSRSYIGRRNNTGSAGWAVLFDGTSLTWQPTSTKPAWYRVMTDVWTVWGWLTYVPMTPVGNGWWTVFSLLTNATIRVRGHTSGSGFNQSASIVDDFYPPKLQILPHPSSQTNNAATTAILSVTAAGIPPLYYRWRRVAVPPMYYLAQKKIGMFLLTSAMFILGCFLMLTIVLIPGAMILWAFAAVAAIRHHQLETARNMLDDHARKVGAEVAAKIQKC